MLVWKYVCMSGFYIPVKCVCMSVSVDISWLFLPIKYVCMSASKDILILRTSKVCLYECKCGYILILFTSKVCLNECKCGYLLIYELTFTTFSLSIWTLLLIWGHVFFFRIICWEGEKSELFLFIFLLCIII